MEVIKSDITRLDIFSDLCDQTASNVTKNCIVICLTTLMIPLSCYFLAFTLRTSTVVLM